MNIQHKLLVIIITLVFLFIIIPPQIKIEAISNENLIFESITTEDGLSQNIVNCIIQDHYGYMWFGTTVGLNKYDGIGFEIFLNDSITSSYNYSSYIQALCETSDGCLWVGTDYGLIRYDSKRDYLASYLNDDSTWDNSIRVIYEDSNGKLWVGTARGLNVYNSETDTFTVYKHNSNDPNSISDNYVRSIYEDSRGTLWIGTTNGLNIYHQESDTFTTYKNDITNDNSISGNYVKAIYEDSRGTLWIGTTNGLNIYHQESDTFTTYNSDVNDINSISNNSITCICEDDNGILWIGTRSGLNRLDIKTMVFNQYYFDAENSNGISSNYILSLCVDMDGLIWIGTINGISKLNLSKQAFIYYTEFLNEQVLGVLDAGDGNLWLQVSEDLILFNIDTEEILGTYKGICEGQNYNNPTYNVLCLGLDGSIWIGTLDSGIKNFNPLTNQIIVYQNEPGNDRSLISNYISSLYVDHTGVLWVGTQDGLCSFNSETQEFNRYTDNAIYQELRSYDMVLTIYETSDFNLWFATVSDIFMLDIKTNQIKHVISSSDFIGNSDEYRIYTMYQDSKGLLWIGRGYRLYCYDIGNESLISYEMNDSMPHDLIMGIIEDNNGDIWLSTRQGLWRFLPQDIMYIKYGLNDGIKSDIFCMMALYKSEDGELFFGTLNGLLSFYPEDISIDTTSPVVMINNFTLIDKTICFDTPIEDIRQISLSYYNNSFEIDFVALDYNSPKNNQYAYMLEGFDKSWIYCNASESFTKYTNLDSGEYIFRVKASNSDGVWNEDGASLKIIITAPFWQEWWFITSLVALMFMAVFMFIKIRTLTLSKRAQDLEFQVEARTGQLIQKSSQLEDTSKKLEESNLALENQLRQQTDYFNALMHDFKTPLTSIVASSDLLSEMKIEKRATLLSNQIQNNALFLKRRISEHFDIFRGKLNLLDIKKELISIYDVVDSVIESTKSTANSKGITVQLKVDPNIPMIFADEQKLIRVMYNLLDNAYKYTPNGKTIMININLDVSYIIVEVQDSGYGISDRVMKNLFEPYHPYSDKNENYDSIGLGLAICKTYVKLHGGEIWVESKLGKGTKFVFTIPI
jgi:ligand-binding sensor domain-containing protein/signal transduction histidine kinase